MEELRATLGWGGCVWGSVWGVAGGTLGVWLGVSWGADECAWEFLGVDGTEVLCFRRWEEVWVETDDRTKGFRCDT